MRAEESVRHEGARLGDQARHAGHDLDQHGRALAHDMEKGVTRGRLGGAPGESFEDQVLRHAGVLGIIGAVLGYKAISTGFISARLFSGEPTKYPVGKIPGILWRLSHNPFDPNEAWEPVNTGGEVPGALTFWGTFVVLFILHILLVVIPLYALHRTWRRPPEGDVEWADGKEMGELLLSSKGDPVHSDKLVVGRFGSKKVGIDRLHSLLVVGPHHSGKTNGVSVPVVLEWDGPALIVSSKGHLMDETIGWRREQGHVRVFDPASATRHERSGWVLLDDCGDWEGAIGMAQNLAAAAYGSIGGRIDGGRDPHHIEHGSLWGGAAAMALAPYLYAAAVTGSSIMHAARWIVREERDEILRILHPIDEVAAHAHETTFHRHDPALTTFFHHIYDMLSVYGDPSVAASATKRDIVPANLLQGRRETLYLFAPEHDQPRFQPLFTMIVRQTLAAINEQYAATGRPLRPRLLVLLDGAASISSIHAVSQMASTGLEKGVEMVTVFDERDWTDELQGNATATLLENHRALLVMQGSWKRHGETASLAGWPEITEQLGSDEAALFYEHHKPMRLELRRWSHEEHLRQRVEHPDRTARHQHHGTQQRTSGMARRPAETPDYVLVDQTTAWRRRGPSREDPLDASAPDSHSISNRARRLNVFSRHRQDDEAEETVAESAARARQRYRPN